jgi:F-type H+-transporting ATPase subunit delta
MNLYLAKIYAKGLFKYAKENSCFYSVLSEIKNKDLFSFFKSKLFKNLSKVSQIFIRLVIEQRRESHLSLIAQEYQRLYRLNLDILRIKIITSASMENSFFSKKLKKILRDKYRKKYMLKCQVNKEIIGGFFLYLENMWWDASVLGQISLVRRKLQEA